VKGIVNNIKENNMKVKVIRCRVEDLEASIEKAIPQIPGRILEMCQVIKEDIVYVTIIYKG
jgi:hypothetical protein